MNKDPEYYQSLFDRMVDKREEIQGHMEMLQDMLYNVENDEDPWDNEEEYQEIIKEIEGVLGE